LRHDVVPAFWPVIDQLMVSGTNFLTNVFVARALGGYQFGLYTLAWTYIFLALAIQMALMGQPMFSLAPKHRESEQEAYFAAMIAQQLVFAAVVFVIAYGSVRAGRYLFASWSYSSYAPALAAAAAAFLWQDFIRRCLFARGSGRAALLCDAISYPGQLALLVVAAISGTNLNIVLWIVAGTSGLSALIGTILMRPLRLEPSAFRPIVAEHWRFGGWLLGANVLGWIAGNAVYVVAGVVLGPLPVAWLRAAELVFAVGNPLYQSIENFLPTHAARTLLDHGQQAFRGFMQRSLLLGLALGASISLVAVAAPSFWLGLFFGTGMSDHGDLVYALAIRNPLIFGLMVACIALRSGNGTFFIFGSEAARAAITVCTVYPVIAVYGIRGAAIAYATWPLSALVVAAWGLRKRFGGRPQTAGIGLSRADSRGDPP
jgi:O-antigen/teichoic acid export membrane protein